MKAHARTIRLTLLAAAALAFLAGCVTATKEIPSGLSVSAIFQRAQEAVDVNDYALGVRYYSLVKDSYPDDVTHMVWASYEIAFLSHKMGKNAEALTLVSALLDAYAGKWDSLPPETAAPRVLAENLKTHLESLTQATK